VVDGVLISEEIITKLIQSKNTTCAVIARELQRFNKMAQIDYEMAIICARKAIDFMLRSSCEIANIKAGTKPLEQIIEELHKSGTLPSIIGKHCKIIKDFGNIAAHGLQSNDLEIEGAEMTEVEVEICSFALTSVASWYISQIIPKTLDIFPFEIVQGKNITEHQIGEAIEIDCAIYKTEYRGIPDICLQWFRRNPDIYTFIIDKHTNKVVGYINSMPLEESYYEKIESGEVIDVNIPTEVIRTYDFPDFYKLYLCSVAVHPDYQGTIAFKMLYEAYFDKLLYLARNDIYITEMLGDVVSEDGEKLAKFIGMKKLKDTTHESSIYKVMLLPPSIRVTTSKAKNLMVLYQKKYEDFKDLLDLSSNV